MTEDTESPQAIEFASGAMICAVHAGSCEDCGMDITAIGHGIDNPENLKPHNVFPCPVCGRDVVVASSIRPHEECEAVEDDEADDEIRMVLR